MKKLFGLLGILLLGAYAVSVQAEETTDRTILVEEDSDLSLHRQTLSEENCICGVIFLGAVDGLSGDYAVDQSCMEQVVKDSGYPEEFTFLADIPDERIVETEYGCEVYCIYPCDPNATVAVYKYVYDDPDDYTGRIGDVLYRSESGDPILLRCNQSDIMSDVEIHIVDSGGNVLVWQPSLSLKDGSVAVPLEEPYVYDASHDYQYDRCIEEYRCLFGMAGEWRTDSLVQENGTDMVYTLQFLAEENSAEGQLFFSFDDPWSDEVLSWYGTYYPYDLANNTCGTYWYSLYTPEGERSGEIFVALEEATLTITDVSGDSFWPFTSGSTEILWFYPYFMD